MQHTGRVIGKMLLVMIGLVIHSPTTHAGKLAGQTLKDLAASYPHIVVVRILSRHETTFKGGFASQGAVSARYQIQVIKVLKGQDLKPVDRVQVDSTPWYTTRPFYDFSPDTQGLAILFLKRDDDFQWNLQPDALRDHDMGPASRQLSGWEDPFLTEVERALSVPQKRGALAPQTPSTPRPLPHIDLGFVWKPDPARLIVAAVRPSSVAAEGGFRSGDIINTVEKTPVANSSQFEDAVGSFAGGSRLNIALTRSGASMTLPLAAPRRIVLDLPAIRPTILQTLIRGKWDLADMLDLPAIRKKAEAYELQRAKDVSKLTGRPVVPRTIKKIDLVPSTGGGEPDRYRVDMGHEGFYLDAYTGDLISMHEE